MFNRKCSTCVEKEYRIKDLLEQVSFLRAMVHPTHISSEVSPQTIEADKVLSGNDESVEYHIHNLEAAKIMSGMWDSDQVIVE